MGDSASTSALLVPVKSFDRAKARLAPVLSAEARRELAREMADRVLDAAGDLLAAVVCDDDDVRSWAAGRGAQVLWAPGRGLNGAVAFGVEALGADGVERVVVAHADLPLATSFVELLDDDSGDIVLVPDRVEDGTNVAVVASGCGFTFAYGPGSFDRHRTEAIRLGLGPRIMRPPRLVWDVDEPADLHLPADISAPPLAAVR